MNSIEKRTKMHTKSVAVVEASGGSVSSFAQSLLVKLESKKITQKEYQESLLLHYKKERRDNLHHLLQLLDLSIPALQILLRKELNQEFSFERIGRWLVCPVKMTNEDCPDEVMVFLDRLSKKSLKH